MNKFINKNYPYLIFVVMTIFITWPVFANFASGIFADPGDPFGNLWRLWWEKYAYINNLDSHLVNIVNAPRGLVLDNFAISISQIFAKYLCLIANEAIAYNFVILFNIFLSGVGMFALVKYLTKNNAASIISGIFCILSSYLTSHANQHLELTGIFWFPLMILYLLKLSKEHNLKNIILSSVFIAGAITQSFYYGYMALIIVIVFTIFFLILKLLNHDKILKFLASIILVGLISLVISLPVTWNTYSDLLGENKQVIENTQTRSRQELKVYSAQYFNYFYPSPENPFLGKYTRDKYNSSITKSGSNLTEQSLYLGWVVIIFAIYFTWLIFNKKVASDKKTTSIFLIILGLVFFYFSFAPDIDIFGYKIKSPANYIFDHLPYFRVYARFGLIVFITTAALSGMGIAYIFDRILNRKLILLVTVLLTFTAIFELINFPPYHYIDLKEKSIPEVYKYLKSQPSGIIAEYPLLPTNTPIGYNYYLWQRYHQMPLLYGAKYKTEDDNLRRELINPEDNNTINSLKGLGIKYIIIHSSMYNSYVAKFFPQEDNYSKIPLITSPDLELINNFNGDILYKIKP